MSGGLFVKDNRARITVDILYSLQWFLLALTLCVTLSYRISDEPFAFCARVIPTAAVFAAVAFSVRITDFIPIRIIVPLAGIVCCILLGQTTAEKIALGLVGVSATVCGVVITLRAGRDKVHCNDMFIFTAVLALFAVVARRSHNYQIASWIDVISAIYLPLCVAAWYINRLANALFVFNRRTDQPTDLIHRRMHSTILSVSLLVLLTALLLPQSDGSSLLTVIFKAGVAIITRLIMYILDRLPTCVTSLSVPSPGYGDSPPLAGYGYDSSWEMYLLYIAAAVLLITLVVWAIVHIVRFVRNIISSFLSSRSGTRHIRTSGYDTVERLDPPEKVRSSPLFARSNAEKIRAIYKKRISAILGGSLSGLHSLSPNEIAELCREKGENIDELTKLYKKARYTTICTDDDVKAARRL